MEERRTQDGELLRSLARRDDDAAERFLSRFKPLLWDLAQRYCSSRTDAEDAVQEIVFEIWKTAGRFDPTRGSASTFVATVARRRLIDRLRRLGTSPLVEEIPEESVATSAASPERRLEMADVSSALAQLRADHRRVLEMSLIEGYTHVEIAHALELPLGTVKTMARRGVRKVRADLHVH